MNRGGLIDPFAVGTCGMTIQATVRGICCRAPINSITVLRRSGLMVSMKRSSAIIRYALTCLFLVFLCLRTAVTPAAALPTGIDLSLNGFGTVALARSTDDSAQFVRDLSQPDGLTRGWHFENDSLLGVQANLSMGPQWQGVLQVVSRYQYDSTFTPEITWGFLRYDPNPVWSLRAGRLGTEFYMLADSRLVGYSYVTVRPPVDFYGTFPFNTVDGLDIAAATPVAGGLLRGKLYAGINQELSPLGRDPDFDMSGSLLEGGYLDFFKGAWQIRLGHSRLRFEHDLPVESFYDRLPTATADELRVAGKWSSFTSFGLTYDGGPLQSQFMLSKTHNDHGTFQDTWAGYLILSYRRGDLTPFIGLSAVKSAPRTLEQPVYPYTDLYQADFHSDQRTTFFGVRWDFMEKMCLKAQVDIVRGTADSIFLYRWETPYWDGSMTVFSLGWDFIF